ncbi:MAG: hypothetical protein QM750_17635 [Rubrivivax sp.]
MTTTPAGGEQSVEQRRYARLLEAGARAGLALLLLGFGAYGSGLLPAGVPPQRLPELWSLPLAQFLQQSGSPTGWSWLARLGQGDMLALGGIAWLASCSLPALLALLPLYLRRGDKVYAVLALAQIAVIALAASGWLTGGAG